MAPIPIDQTAPTFSCTAVVDGRLKNISLKAYTDAAHWVVIAFFPHAWSLICPTEIIEFSARADDFLYMRACAVLFISTDSAETLQAWNAKSPNENGLGGVHLPLLSDCSQKLSRSYGILNERSGCAQRAMFIIDPRGMVRTSTVYDINIARSVEETLRLLDALKFNDESGRGCPADWKRGDQGVDLYSGDSAASCKAVVTGRKFTLGLPKFVRTISNGNLFTTKSGQVDRLEADRAEQADLAFRRCSGPLSPGAASLSSNSKTRRDSVSDGQIGASYFKPIYEQQGNEHRESENVQF